MSENDRPVESSRGDRLPLGKSCGYGSCDKPPQHTGDHRCRCGRLVDLSSKGCAWHKAPTLAQMVILADRDAALAIVERVRALHNSDGERREGFPRADRLVRYCTGCQEAAPCTHARILDGGDR